MQETRPERAPSAENCHSLGSVSLRYCVSGVREVTVTAWSETVRVEAYSASGPCSLLMSTVPVPSRFARRTARWPWSSTSSASQNTCLPVMPVWPTACFASGWITVVFPVAVSRTSTEYV